MVSSYEALLMTHYILDAAFDELDSESLSVWASDSDPFLFKAVGSADPAFYIEFKEAWDERFGMDSKVGYEECKLFIADFLATLPDGCDKAFNAVVDDAKWEDQMKEVQLQAQERIKYLSEDS